MNTFSHRHKINPSKDLKLLSQDWVFVKTQQKTENLQFTNNQQTNRKGDIEGEYNEQNSLSDLRVYERSSAIPFCHGQQTFYTGIRDSSYEIMHSNKNTNNRTLDNFVSSSINTLPTTKPNHQLYTQLNNNSLAAASLSLSKTPFKRAIKSSRESSDKSTMMNSIQRFTIRESKVSSSLANKPYKRLNQTMEISHNDTNYDFTDQGAMLSSVQYFSQNNSLVTVQGSSDKKGRSSQLKNSIKRSKLQNNLSGSFLVKSSVTIEDKGKDKDISEEQEDEDDINDVKKWTEHTAIFADTAYEQLPGGKYSKSEVQQIIDGLFQEIEERDKDRTLEKEVMGKYQKQRKERLAKSQLENKIQRVNNTNIILNYSRGKDLQSNANGFQMSKYLYDQKYGHYKCIPQSYNTEVIPKEEDLTCSMLNKPDYKVKELKSIPVKSIYNPEIDDSKRYLAAIRMSEREQYQLKIPASKMMQNVLQKYDNDTNFVVQDVEQQQNQNIIQETYRDYLKNPAKRLNLSKIKQNQIIQNNLYDSRYVKSFIQEEENISECNLFTNNSRNNDAFSPSQRKNREISTFSKYHKLEGGTPRPNENINPTPRGLSSFDHESIQNNGAYNFSHFIQPQKSLFSPLSLSIQQQQQSPQRNTPIRFKRHPFDTNVISPHAPISRSVPKKKKINIKTNLNEINKIQEARISSPFVKVSDCERGMKQNVSSERQKFYDSWYSPASERQNNLDRHLMKYQNNKQYQQKLVQQYMLLKSNDTNINKTIVNKNQNKSIQI